MLLLLLTLPACAPSLEEAPGEAAARYCDRAVTCNWRAAEDFDACVDELEEGYFSTVMIIDACQDVDPGGWRSCVDAIDAVECESVSRGINEINASCEAVAVCAFME